MVQLDNKVEDMEEALDEEAAAASAETPKSAGTTGTSVDAETKAMDASFMSESIYEKIPSPRSWKHKTSSTALSLIQI